MQFLQKLLSQACQLLKAVEKKTVIVLIVIDQKFEDF